MPESIKSASSKVSEKDGTKKSASPQLEDPANLLQLMEELALEQTKHQEIVKTFLKKDVFTRADLTKLQTYVNCYDSLNDILDRLADSHAKWLPLCGKSEEDLNNEKDKLSPEIFDPFLIQLEENR